MRNKDVLKKLKNLPDNTKEYIDQQHYYEYPTVHYDSTKYTKGYVDVTELKPDIIYKTPKYPEVELGTASRICICCKNDDGSLLIIDNKENMMGFCHVENPLLFIFMKSEKSILLSYKSNTYDYTISLKKSDGVWKIAQFINNIPYQGCEYEFVPSTDYSPATKKYVDDATNTLVKKDTNKYILITNDDTLVIKKASITDIANATITIDNLTGKFGKLVANDNGTYSYTLNTIMTDVETFIFKVNNIEQKLVIVPYKEMTYDDKNAGITYEGNWYEDTNNKYYKKSSHYTKGSDNNVSKLSFIFTGTAVRFIGMTSKALGQNNIRSQIFVVNSDGSVGTTASYTSITDNNITSTDDILYNTSLVYNNIDDKLGYGKYKSVLTSGKGSSGYIDRIIIYNTIQKLNDSIESLYNQKEAAPTVLRTDIPNTKFEPKELYDPATKDYVDKTVAASTVNMCTDEEVDNMLNEVLGGDYSGN